MGNWKGGREGERKEGEEGMSLVDDYPGRFVT